MLSPRNTVSSTRRQLFLKFVIPAKPTFGSLATAPASPTDPFSGHHQFITSSDDRRQTQARLPANYDRTAGIASQPREFGLPQKYELLIEKCRLSCSDFDSKQVHSDIIKNGIGNDLFAGNTLISSYFRTGNISAARKVFNEMPYKNPVTWSCLISGYTQNEILHDALAAFSEMFSSGVFPTHYALGSALRSCQKMGSGGLRHGIQIHGLISKTHHSFDVVICNVLISMYSNCIVGPAGSILARRLFDTIADKNPVSYNSIISVYSQRGDVRPTFDLFSEMRESFSGSDFGPNEYTYGSLITAASESVDADDGCFLLKQLLAKIEMSGLMEDLYVGSALVSGFGKLGEIDIAKGIFQKMGTRNVVSLNGLMVGLVKFKRAREAVEIFLEAKGLVKVKLNSDSYVLLLSAFGEFSCLEEGKRKGKEVHGYVTRTGINDSSVSVGNSLINMYAKCRSIKDARSVFISMLDKDSVTWSSIISGLDQNERFEDALSCFVEMKKFELIPSNFTLISTLSSCASLGWIWMGEQIHCEAIKLGLDLDVSVSNTLLTLYADTKCITKCRKLFSLMPDHDSVSWNSILRAFKDNETSIIEASKYFLRMMRSGWSPNNVTFTNILSAAASLCNLELTRQIHCLALKHQFTEDNIVKNSLLTCYGKCGQINECEILFSRMVDKDEVAWNSMISGYLHDERLVEAMDLVKLMLQNGQRLDLFTFATVLSACASVATLEHGMEIHACAAKARLASDVVIGSALVDMYAKCGRIEYASRFFERMPVKNVYSWNSMISGYARHGDGEKALEIFARMKIENQQKPDHVTFVGVLSACSHMGLVREGYEHFESMTEIYSLTPKIEHFSCMVDLLGRAGEFNKLEEFINNMPIDPNVLIWRTVLSACGRSSGRTLDLGKRAAKMIIDLEPHNAVNYVLVANMYASGAKWEYVAEARRAMKTAKVRKEAGCSWVSMRDGIHVFVSGDKLHANVGKIYEKLGELYGKMKAKGYTPEVKYALYDVEMENKEEVLSYHSEKLAVAFVLTRECESKLPIRIMKNLRVCGDCHLAFKYISEIVGRRIVLRDSNRPHTRKTDEAWQYYTQCPHLPSAACLSRLVSQLSYLNTAEGLTRAQSIIQRLRLERQLHRLDANSLGLLAVAAAKGGHTLYAASIVKSMLKSGYLPHVKAWSAVVSRLSSSGDDGPTEALKLFHSVTKRVRRLQDSELDENSRPDTGAYNAVLNACANLGDVKTFHQLFDEMPQFKCEPNILTYNIMIKFFARVERKDLLVYVLERIIQKEIPICLTTLHSLVAAYVGFGDLETAEKLVQAMREKRLDLCRILRDSCSNDSYSDNSDDDDDDDDDDDEEEEEDEVIRHENDLFVKLLPNYSIDHDYDPPPDLPNPITPDTRIYTTLMKGYMKVGRVADTVRMLEAMSHQEDTLSHPDHVTYTTVISAFVKSGSMEKARQVLKEMARIQIPANLVTYNILLKGYCHQHQIDKAESLIHEMVESKIEPDVISYNTLIDGCILVDDFSGAFTYFNEMRKRGIAPSKVSYTTLMKAFATSGQPRLAGRVFDEMLRDPRVKVDLVAWNVLVEGYCKLGLVDEAKGVIQKMKENGFFPNVATYGSLANGIAIARKPGEALLLWKEVKERCGPENEKIPALKPDEGLLDALADICVRAAFFRKALEIVACMEENGISPNKTKYKRIYVEMHSRMFTSKHASQARKDRRKERKRAAEAFKFWLGLPNEYYESEWRLDQARR
ncbi:pentatricopeptide repeat-containing protein [Striga asiatica]|uniref:Pentatricopeptide repeat-containing protein n=1 Tax=Striga asiatica TaxID=4170 RepID=A0A5A7R9C5_STRAF|nr:pentatricopeptide repeat-containing protein [Striga asiatica]